MVLIYSGISDPQKKVWGGVKRKSEFFFFYHGTVNLYISQPLTLLIALASADIKIL